MSVIGDAISGAVSGFVSSIIAPLAKLFNRNQDRRDGATDNAVAAQAEVIKGNEDARKIEDRNAAAGGDDAADLAKLRAQRDAAGRR